MFLAHLVGDYILQWDRLAQWKSQELRGVLVHSLIVFGVTWLFALPFAPGWWEGIIFIGVIHFIIDALPHWIKLPFSPIARFLLDQALHVIVIVVALAAGGFLDLSAWPTQVVGVLEEQYVLAYALGYAFLTMPAWVLLKFLGYRVLKGCGPMFPDGINKYFGIGERLLITTLVLMGSFLLVPLAALPRLVLEWPNLLDGDRRPVLLFELLVGFTLAVAVGIGLRLVSL